jgi:dUTP pyrophosphatase
MTSFENPKYMLNIKIDSNDENIIKHYSSFKYNYDGDSGIDLINDKISVLPFEIGTLDYKIKCEMIDIESNKYISYLLVPRSSISKTTFQMANSIGIIDAAYRGNILAKIRNININEQVLNQGSYFQIIAPDLKPIKVNIVNELSITDRDNKGFGSTKLTDIINFEKINNIV